MLCCQSFFYQGYILSDKVKYLFMVLGGLVTRRPALNDFQFGYGYLDGFNAFAVNGRRQDKGIFF
jgi:hypothetical protein